MVSVTSRLHESIYESIFYVLAFYCFSVLSVKVRFGLSAVLGHVQLAFAPAAAAAIVGNAVAAHGTQRNVSLAWTPIVHPAGQPMTAGNARWDTAYRDHLDVEVVRNH